MWLLIMIYELCSNYCPVDARTQRMLMDIDCLLVSKPVLGCLQPNDFVWLL